MLPAAGARLREPRVPDAGVVGVGEQAVPAILGVGDVARVQVEGRPEAADLLGGGDRVVGDALVAERCEPERDPAGRGGGERAEGLRRVPAVVAERVVVGGSRP